MDDEIKSINDEIEAIKKERDEQDIESMLEHIAFVNHKKVDNFHQKCKKIKEMSILVSSLSNYCIISKQNLYDLNKILYQLYNVHIDLNSNKNQEAYRHYVNKNSKK